MEGDVTVTYYYDSSLDADVIKSVKGISPMFERNIDNIIADFKEVTDNNIKPEIYNAMFLGFAFGMYTTMSPGSKINSCFVSGLKSSAGLHP